MSARPRIFDRPIKTPDGRGNQWDTVHDANGNPIFVGLTVGGAFVDGHYAVWDGLDRLERRVGYAGHATLKRRNALGHLLELTGPDGYRIGFERDALGRIGSVFDEEGQRVAFDLDVLGRVRAVTDANGLATRFEHHGEAQDGRLRSTTLPRVSGQAQGRASEVVAWDGAGRPLRIEHVAADGTRRDSYRFHDELGRLTRSVGAQTSAGDSRRPVTCLVYTTLGEVREVWAGATTDTASRTCNLADPAIRRQVSRVHDDWGRLLAETDALGRTWRWGWDRHGQRVSNFRFDTARQLP